MSAALALIPIVALAALCAVIDHLSPSQHPANRQQRKADQQHDHGRFL